MECYTTNSANNKIGTPDVLTNIVQQFAVTLGATCHYSPVRAAAAKPVLPKYDTKAMDEKIASIVDAPAEKIAGNQHGKRSPHKHA
ncbi:MAG TPA: hypothetical protein VHB73_00860 [Alphaproteobacteria bacterium]|nr:hypothetical protein [Alphaproteobacteria bacterium]